MIEKEGGRESTAKLRGKGWNVEASRPSETNAGEKILIQSSKLLRMPLAVELVRSASDSFFTSCTDSLKVSFRSLKKLLSGALIFFFTIRLLWLNRLSQPAATFSRLFPWASLANSTFSVSSLYNIRISFIERWC